MLLALEPHTSFLTLIITPQLIHHVVYLATYKFPQVPAVCKAAPAWSVTDRTCCHCGVLIIYVPDLDREMKELEQKQKAVRAALREVHDEEERLGYAPTSMSHFPPFHETTAYVLLEYSSRNDDVESEDEEDYDHILPSRNGTVRFSTTS